MTLLTPFKAPQDPSPSRVERADASNRLAVLTRLLGRNRDHALRFLRYAAAEGISLEWLWGSFTPDGRVEAAALLSPGPGRTAMMTISPLRGRREEEAAVRVLAAAQAEAPRLDLAIVQALLDPRQSTEEASLLSAGFRTIASLAYMERSVAGVDPALSAQAVAGPLPAGASLEPYDDRPASRESLAQLLAETYEDTLDCPGLSGLRSPQDVLAGHRRGGRFDPSLWTILALRGRPVGALLLNEAQHAAGLDLVYLGLVPEARGRGFGRVLLARAISLAQARGDRSIMLAVDEENAPALRLYRAAGFRRTAQRRAFVASVKT